MRAGGELSVGSDVVDVCAERVEHAPRGCIRVFMATSWTEFLVSVRETDLRGVRIDLEDLQAAAGVQHVLAGEQPASQCDAACGDLTDAHRWQRAGGELVAQPHLGQSLCDGMTSGVPDLLS